MGAPGENPKETVCLELNLHVVAAPMAAVQLAAVIWRFLLWACLTLVPKQVPTFLNLHCQPSGAPNKILSCLSSQNQFSLQPRLLTHTPLPQAAVRITRDDGKDLSIRWLLDVLL